MPFEDEPIVVIELRGKPKIGHAARTTRSIFAGSIVKGLKASADKEAGKAGHSQAIKVSNARPTPGVAINP
jgi:hypothetical protein